MSIITKPQLRAARALLGWSQAEISQKSGVSLPSIKRIEPGDEGLKIRLDTLEKIKNTYEEAGVEFISNETGAGVLLKK